MAATLKPAPGATTFHIERVVYRWPGATDAIELSMFLPQQFTEASTLRADHEKALALSVPRFGNDAEITVAFRGRSSTGKEIEIAFPTPVDSSTTLATAATTYLNGMTADELVGTILAQKVHSPTQGSMEQEVTP